MLFGDMVKLERGGKDKDVEVCNRSCKNGWNLLKISE